MVRLFESFDSALANSNGVTHETVIHLLEFTHGFEFDSRVSSLVYDRKGRARALRSNSAPRCANCPCTILRRKLAFGNESAIAQHAINFSAVLRKELPCVLSAPCEATIPKVLICMRSPLSRSASVFLARYRNKRPVSWGTLYRATIDTRSTARITCNKLAHAIVSPTLFVADFDQRQMIANFGQPRTYHSLLPPSGNCFKLSNLDLVQAELHFEDRSSHKAVHRHDIWLKYDI